MKLFLDILFLYTLNNYKKDFIKKTHDHFINRMKEFNKIGDKKDADNIYKNLFIDIIEETLNDIINISNNLYTVINNKIELLNIL